MARETRRDPLEKYWSNRDFTVTSEPRGERKSSKAKALSFVIQKHAASRLRPGRQAHGDPRRGPPAFLWIVRGDHSAQAVRRGHGRRLGHGTWEPVGDPREGLQKGKLLFHLRGHKLAGLWELVKIAKGGEKQEPWILFKKRDPFARPRVDYDVVSALPDSVIAKPLRAAAPTGKAAAKAPTKRVGPTRKSEDTEVPGAVKAPLPVRISPQLATLATGVPAAGQWLFEIKFDGYRIMTRIEGGKALLLT